MIKIRDGRAVAARCVMEVRRGPDRLSDRCWTVVLDPGLEQPGPMTHTEVASLLTWLGWSDGQIDRFMREDPA